MADTLTPDQHQQLAAKYREHGYDLLAQAHEREARRAKRAPYQVSTAYDLPTGDQIDVTVGFDVEPGEREPCGRGSPDILPSVVVVWIERPEGVLVDFDALTPDQQRQLVGACEAELDARNR